MISPGLNKVVGSSRRQKRRQPRPVTPNGRSRKENTRGFGDKTKERRGPIAAALEPPRRRGSEAARIATSAAHHGHFILALQGPLAQSPEPMQPWPLLSLQLPAPSHAHLSPLAQPPLVSSHFPVSWVFCAIGVQVPGVVPLQVWQRPQSAEGQQTPSVQCELPPVHRPATHETMPPQPSGALPVHFPMQATAAVFGVQPHWFAMVPPPQVSGSVQVFVEQSRDVPQLSFLLPVHCIPQAAPIVGVEQQVPPLHSKLPAPHAPRSQLTVPPQVSSAFPVHLFPQAATSPAGLQQLSAKQTFPPVQLAMLVGVHCTHFGGLALSQTLPPEQLSPGLPFVVTHILFEHVVFMQSGGAGHVP
jgi:hypothetical protein